MRRATDIAPVGYCGLVVVTEQIPFGFSVRLHDPINAKPVGALIIFDGIEELTIGIFGHPIFGL
jgi:hypothetical protein